MDDENHPIMEGILELTLNTLVNELMMLCETIMDFKNLEDNGFDFSETLEFKAGTNLDDDKSPSAKDLTNSLRVWFKIIMDCIHHSSGTNSSDYVNTRKKFMLFFLEKGLKLAPLSILFKFLRDSIRESVTGGSSKKSKSNFIPNGRLISDILVENGMVDDLLVSGLTNELVKGVEKIF
ncbi:hypothetical protein KIW84_022830 [Lathyrus oleraceus]|uniref:Uncharacterized protein n=1 Tax=Pisum sativum TaxID=3888 RepID=A0A9D4YFA5_PEA|nr:hypothetical protein KIW84_022830 [Pisum sativum]